MYSVIFGQPNNIRLCTRSSKHYSLTSDPSPQILPHQHPVDAPRETEGLPHLCRQRRLPGTGRRVQGLDDQDLGEERQQEHDQRQLQTNKGESQKL